MGTITTTRVYDALTGGYRILVDRLWPRGMTHERAHLDLWEKDIAPSPELREWWGHNPETMDEFADRYRAELDTNPAVGTMLQIISQHQETVLVYAAKDPHVNHAIILAKYLQEAHLSS